MASAYVNFFSRLDGGGYGRGAQAYQGRASQTHRAAAAVGAAAATATVVELDMATQYVEVRPTSGAVFACVLASGSPDTECTARRIRIDEGEKISLSRGDIATAAALYLWAA